MSVLHATGAGVGEDDEDLLAQLRRGVAPAFERLMRRYNRRLYRVARSMLRDAAEAEDAVQEAYLCAYRAAGSFRADASVATWLTRIVVNECMTRLRRSSRRQALLNLVPQPSGDEEGARMEPEPESRREDSPDAMLMRSELRALLERKIDELPEQFRVVFMLRFVEDLSVDEVAKCLAVPEATVRSRAFRARSLMRAAIAEELDIAQLQAFDFDGERCDRIVARVLREVA